MGRDWGCYEWGPDTNMNEDQADGFVDDWTPPVPCVICDELLYDEYSPSELKECSVNDLLNRIYDIWNELRLRGIIP